MVNPFKGILAQDEGYLGKGIEAKILIEEVEQTSLNLGQKNPLGLRMFNYKNIDLEFDQILEEALPDSNDIDRIEGIIGLKNLRDKKTLPPTAAEIKAQNNKLSKKVFELQPKIANANKPGGPRGSFIVKDQDGEQLITPRLPRGVSSENIITSFSGTKIRSGSFYMANVKDRQAPTSVPPPEIDEDQAEQDALNQLLMELATTEEDQPKIEKFIDYYFNELVYKEVLFVEKNQNRTDRKEKQTPLLADSSKNVYLHKYMEYLRSKIHIAYDTYGIADNQLDGNLMGAHKMQLYPTKIKTTNQIDVKKIEEMIGTLSKSGVLDQEETTRDIAVMIYQLVKGASSIDSPYSKIQKIVTYEFWDSFFHGTLIDNFEKIYLCYLIKMEYFKDQQYVNSSVYYYGEIINHLLEKTGHQDDLFRFKASFTRVIEVNIGLFKSVFLRIFEHFRDKAIGNKPLKLQNYTIKDPLGIVGLILTIAKTSNS